MVVRCPRCGFIADKLGKLQTEHSIHCCPKCGLLILRKNQLKWVTDMAFSPLPDFGDIRETRMFGLQGSYGICTLMVVEESGEFHAYNKCMSCGDVITGIINIGQDEETGRLLYLCDKCVEKRMREILSF